MAVKRMEQDNKETDATTSPVVVRADHAQEEPAVSSEEVATGQTPKDDEVAANATSAAGESTSSDAAADDSGQKATSEGLTIEQAHDKERDKSDASVEQVMNTEKAESAEQPSSTVEVPQTNGETKRDDTATERVQTTGGTEQSSAEDSKSPDQLCTAALEPQSGEESKQSTKVEEVQSTDAAGISTSEQPRSGAAEPHQSADEVKQSLSDASSEQVQTATDTVSYTHLTLPTIYSV